MECLRQSILINVEATSEESVGLLTHGLIWHVLMRMSGSYQLGPSPKAIMYDAKSNNFILIPK